MSLNLREKSTKNRLHPHKNLLCNLFHDFNPKLLLFVPEEGLEKFFGFSNADPHSRSAPITRSTLLPRPALLTRDRDLRSDVNGVTALMKAAGNGHMPVVEELLYHGAGMWCAGPTDDPKTPFMWAAHHGHLSVIRFENKYDAWLRPKVFLFLRSQCPSTVR